MPNESNYYILPGVNKDYRYQMIQENITLTDFQVDNNGLKFSSL